jgi:transcriptional regulator with XRE-family HTH domain
MNKNKLKELREQNKLTLRELEQKVGINFKTLSRLENGETKLTDKYLKILADFYQVSYDYIFNRTINELQEMNYPENKIEKLLSNHTFKNALETKVIALVTLLADNNDLKLVESLIVHLLKLKGIDYEDELKKRYLINDNDDIMRIE